MKTEPDELDELILEIKKYPWLDWDVTETNGIWIAGGDDIEQMADGDIDCGLFFSVRKGKIYPDDGDPQTNRSMVGCGNSAYATCIEALEHYAMSFE